MQAILFAATAQAENSKLYYQDLLGLTLLQDTPFALVFNVDGITLRVQKVGEVVLAPYTTLGFAVKDLQQTVSLLSTAGVRFERYSFMEQDASGIWKTPDGACVAWCKDPDGNTVSFTQYP